MSHGVTFHYSNSQQCRNYIEHGEYGNKCCKQHAHLLQLVPPWQPYSPMLSFLPGCGIWLICGRLWLPILGF